MNTRNSIIALLAAVGMSAGCAGELMPVDPAANPGAGAPAGTGAANGVQPGEITNPTKPDAQGQTVFNSTVKGAIEAKCSGCHTTTAPAFAAGDIYASVIDYQAEVLGNYNVQQARLLLVARDAPHYDKQWSPEEATAISDWITLEYDERIAAPTTAPGGGEPPPPAPGQPSARDISRKLQEDFRNCMDLGQWQQLDVADLWANKGTNQGVCASCHSSVTSGFVASNDDAYVFNLMKQGIAGDDWRYYQTSYFTPVVVDPQNPQNANFTPVMAVNYDRFNRAGDRNLAPEGHPAFNVQGNPMQALEQYVNVTNQAVAAGNCSPVAPPAGQ